MGAPAAVQRSDHGREKRAALISSTMTDIAMIVSTEPTGAVRGW